MKISSRANNRNFPHDAQLTCSALQAELAELLQREAHLKKICAVQIRIKKLEVKLMLTPTYIAKQIRIIGEIVSREMGVPWFDITSKSKIGPIADARQLVCYFARMFELTLSDVGRQMNLNHGTVIHAEKKILNWLETDQHFAAKVSRLRPKIQAALEKDGLISRPARVPLANPPP